MNLSNAYNVKLNIPFGKLESFLNWCQNNCESDWSFDDNSSLFLINEIEYAGYNFYFQSERDYVAFLIWKT